MAWKTSEVSDLLVKVVLVQETQGHDPKPLASCHPATPGAHHVKSGCSQKPLQFLQRAALSCHPPMVSCILTEILDNPTGAFAGTVTGCGKVRAGPTHLLAWYWLGWDSVVAPLCPALS